MSNHLLRGCWVENLTFLQPSVYEERPILLLEEREALRQQLERWRSSLPNHLNIEDSDSEALGSSSTETSFIQDWRARQQSSLRIREYKLNQTC